MAQQPPRLPDVRAPRPHPLATGPRRLADRQPRAARARMGRRANRTEHPAGEARSRPHGLARRGERVGMKHRVLIACFLAALIVSPGTASAAYDPTFTGFNGLLAHPRVPPPETFYFSGGGWAVIPEQGDGGCSRNASLWLTRARPLGPYTIRVL